MAKWKCHNRGLHVNMSMLRCIEDMARVENETLVWYVVGTFSESHSTMLGGPFATQDAAQSKIIELIK